MIVSIIVAMDEKGGIGEDGKLPWHISDDLKRFKRLTMGHPIIMGRKTHESIGKVLPGRKNVIITRRQDYQVEGAVICHSPEDALRACAGAEQVFITGGAEIYQLFLPLTNRIYLTRVHQTFPDIDTFFPDWNPALFKEIEREDASGDITYSLVTLEQRHES